MVRELIKLELNSDRFIPLMNYSSWIWVVVQSVKKKKTFQFFIIWWIVIKIDSVWFDSECNERIIFNRNVTFNCANESCWCLEVGHENWRVDQWIWTCRQTVYELRTVAVICTILPCHCWDDVEEQHCRRVKFCGQCRCLCPVTVQVQVDESKLKWNRHVVSSSCNSKRFNEKKTKKQKGPIG